MEGERQIPQRLVSHVPLNAKQGKREIESFKAANGMMCLLLRGRHAAEGKLGELSAHFCCVGQGK